MYNKVAGRSVSEWISFLKSKGAPEKLIDQIKAIERSGKEYGRSKEYIMRTIGDKIPKKYLEEPTAVHGPDKSGPKSDSKASPNAEPVRKSIELDPKSHKSIEDTITKIASVNNIDNVSFVTMNLTHNDCIMKFNYIEK